MPLKASPRARAGSPTRSARTNFPEAAESLALRRRRHCGFWEPWHQCPISCVHSANLAEVWDKQCRCAQDPRGSLAAPHQKHREGPAIRPSRGRARGYGPSPRPPWPRREPPNGSGHPKPMGWGPGQGSFRKVSPEHAAADCHIPQEKEGSRPPALRDGQQDGAAPQLCTPHGSARADLPQTLAEGFLAEPGPHGPPGLPAVGTYVLAPQVYKLKKVLRAGEMDGPGVTPSIAPELCRCDPKKQTCTDSDPCNHQARGCGGLGQP